MKGFIHSLGHGVGLTIGEPPYISLRSSNSLKNGHVFTVEPGLYDPDIGGVRIEDTVAVLDDSCVNLTPLNKFLELWFYPFIIYSYLCLILISYLFDYFAVFIIGNILSVIIFAIIIEYVATMMLNSAVYPKIGGRASTGIS